MQLSVQKYIDSQNEEKDPDAKREEDLKPDEVDENGRVIKSKEEKKNDMLKKRMNRGSKPTNEPGIYIFHQLTVFFSHSNQSISGR